MSTVLSASGWNSKYPISGFMKSPTVLNLINVSAQNKLSLKKLV